MRISGKQKKAGKRGAWIIFTRVPKAGQTKTRLIPSLGAKGASVLQACMLRDLAVQAKKTDADLYVFYTPQGDAALLKCIFGSRAFYHAQQGETLGERMRQAFATVLAKGYTSAVLTGSDLPALRAADIRDAFRMLETRDVVFGPALDGGYYLVGLRRLLPGLFDLERYGHGRVLRQTLRSLRTASRTAGGQPADIRAGFVRMQGDLDTPEDVLSFCDAMRRKKRLQRTRTGRFLAAGRSVSVILPVYNEEKTIAAMQEQLRPFLAQCEIVFADGGSTDRTLSLIDPAFRVLRTAKGRAAQMNAGAAATRGDILFFLHCDSVLPADWPEEIRSLIMKKRYGCFGLRFAADGLFFRIADAGSNLRAFCLGLPFGDQGMFLERRLFEEAGGFPDLPLMEDYQLALRLKEMGERPGRTKHRIVTSARRYPEGTPARCRHAVTLWRLRRMYRKGVPVERIAAWYKDLR